VATEIKIKRSGSSNAPTALGSGELAYSWSGGTGGKLFIGWGAEVNGEAANIDPIGGKYYTDLLGSTAGSIAGSKAVILDANSKVNQWIVDNITIDGNTISTTDNNGNLLLSPHGSGVVSVEGSKISNVVTPTADSDAATKGYVDTQLSGVSSTITLTDDASNTDAYTTGNALTFAGGTGLTSVVTDDTVTFNMDNTSVSFGGVSVALGGTSAQPAFDLTNATSYPTSSLSGTITNDQLAGSIANGKLANSSVTVTAGDGLSGGGSVALGASVSLAVGVDDATIETNSDVLRVKDGGVSNTKLANSSLTVGTTAISLGGSSTALAGLTQVDVDNIRIDGNTISTTDAGESTLFLNPGPVGDSGEVVILGDLTVQGTTTTINSTEVSINDLVLTLADSADDGTAANGAGIIIGSSSFSSPPSLTYDGSNDRWVFNKTVEATIHDLSETIDDRVNTLFTDGQSIGSVYDDAANTLTVNVDIATTSAIGVAKFDGLAESDGGSTNQFTLTSGGVRVTALDGGTY
jgi:hypothetical protein